MALSASPTRTVQEDDHHDIIQDTSLWSSESALVGCVLGQILFDAARVIESEDTRREPSSGNDEISSVFADDTRDVDITSCASGSGSTSSDTRTSCCTQVIAKSTSISSTGVDSLLQKLNCVICCAAEREFSLLPCCHFAVCKHCLVEMLRKNSNCSMTVVDDAGVGLRAVFASDSIRVRKLMRQRILAQVRILEGVVEGREVDCFDEAGVDNNEHDDVLHEDLGGEERSAMSTSSTPSSSHSEPVVVGAADPIIEHGCRMYRSGARLTTTRERSARKRRHHQCKCCLVKGPAARRAS
ncbi:unnamed protein product [Amoebophrya sp. A25]|nr:unnamed protein product [Amoebophrya sp. A25]|eukprot:GSA25T00022964001.1